MPDRHIVPRVMKRGWRSGKPGSWITNPNYQFDIREGLGINLPYNIDKMSNGAWRFFWMDDSMPWFERNVPMPPDPGMTTEKWAEWLMLDEFPEFVDVVDVINNINAIFSISLTYNKEISDDNDDSNS